MRKTSLAGVALALVAATALPGQASARERPMSVVVPLVAEPAAAEEMTERTVGLNEPFLKQRHSALRSATLQGDITLAARAGPAVFDKGTRLILAVSEGSDGDIFCAAYNPAGATTRWVVSVYRVEWMCFQDADKDLNFDKAYLTPSTGALMPAFATLQSPRDVTVGYTIDPQDDRYYLETALFQEEYFNIYGMVMLRMKARRQGDEAWTNTTSTTRGVTGGYSTFSPSRLPQDVVVMGANVRVLARTGDQLTVQPLGVQSGVLVHRVVTGYR